MKRLISVFCIIISMSFLFGCGSTSKSLASIGRNDIYNDAVRAVNQDYPNVTIISTVNDVNIEQYSSAIDERQVTAVIIVNENGIKQAIGVLLRYEGYSGQYYGDVSYVIFAKSDVSD